MSAQTPQERSPAPRSLPRRLLRLLTRATVGVLQLAALLLLITIAALLGWLNSADFQRRSTSAVEAAVEEQLGEQATVSRVAIGFWPPHVDIDGFHVFDAATGDTILSAERIRAPLVLRSGKPALGRLALQAPVVHLHLSPDGKLRELRRMKRAAKPKPLTSLPWSTISITDGTFTFDWSGGSVALRGIEVQPTVEGLTSLDARLTLQQGDYKDRFPLHWQGLTLGPEVIDIPALRIESTALNLEGHARWPLGQELDVQLVGRADLDGFTGILPPPRAAHGLVDLDVRLEGLVEDPQLSLALLAAQFELELPATTVPVVTYRFGDVTLAASARRDQVDVERLALHWADGDIVATATIDPASKVAEAVHIVGTNLSLQRALQALSSAPTPWVDLRADAEINATGTLMPLELTGPFDLAVKSFRVGDRPIDAPDVQLMLDIPWGFAEGQLRMTKEHIVLDVADVATPRNHGHAQIDVGFKPKGPLDLSFILDKANLADFQPLRGVKLTGRGRVGGRIRGPFNKLTFEGSGDLNQFSALGTPYAEHLSVARIHSPDMKSIMLDEARATRGESTYSGNFALDFHSPLRMDTDLVLEQGRVQDILGMFIDLPGMTGDMRGSLSLHGPLNDMDGAAHFTFADTSLWGERFPVGEAHGFMDKGLFTLDELRLTRHERQESLVMRGTVQRAWALNMELFADGLLLERADHLSTLSTPLAGKLFAHAVIENTLFEPAPRGELRVDELRVSGEPLPDSRVHFTSKDGVMTWRADALGSAIVATGTQGLFDQQPYAIAATLRDVPAHVFYPLAADQSPVRALLGGQVNLNGHFGETWSPVSLQAEIDSASVTWRDIELKNKVPWRYTQEGDLFTLDQFGLIGGGTDLSLSGTGGDGLALSGGGTVDLALLGAFVPGVQRAEGTANLTVVTEGKRPDIQAKVELEGNLALLRHSSIPAAFEDLNFRATLTGDRFDLTEISGNIGGGRITGSGQIDAERWYPSRWNLVSRVRDAQVRWIDELPPALGDADLYFDGPTEALLLSGEVRIKEMLFRDRITWEDWVVSFREEIVLGDPISFEEEPLFSFDMHIDAPRTIRLRNNVAEGTASADLHLIGDTVRPGLLGEVRIEDGLAILQDRTFRIERGQLNFDDPWSWDPKLDFEMVTDIQSRDQSYRINYQVLGPFSDWRTIARSDPNLPQADVNALLWFGVTTEDLEEMGELPTAIAQGVADLVLADLFSATQVGELAEVPELLFDRIDVATGVNARGDYSSEPRLVVEKRLDELGDINLRWEFNLGRPEDNYVRAEKRVGGIWRLSGWYATLQRDRVLPIGGAYGFDLTARWEVE